MRFVFTRSKPGEIDYGLLFGAILALSLLIVRYTPATALLPSCAVKSAFGIPCPTCGSTRALVNIAHAHLSAAFLFNPIVTVCCIAVLLYFVYSFVVLACNCSRIRIRLSDREGTAVRIIAAAAFLAQWVYLLSVQ